MSFKRLSRTEKSAVKQHYCLGMEGIDLYFAGTIFLQSRLRYSHENGPDVTKVHKNRTYRIYLRNIKKSQNNVLGLHVKVRSFFYSSFSCFLNLAVSF
jgi:hypothetical protein